MSAQGKNADWKFPFSTGLLAFAIKVMGGRVEGLKEVKKYF